MHVVWKRPDGYHGATPDDFHVVTIGGGTNFWLHRKDQEWFPFRIAGGWQESEATAKLNALINLLGQDDAAWVACLVKIYNDTMGDEAKRFFSETRTWIGDLRNHLKGDTWEVDIMDQALAEVDHQLAAVETDFLAKCAN